MDDENTEEANGEWRQCFPTQTAENHKTANTPLPGACDCKPPRGTQSTRTHSSKHRAVNCSTPGHTPPMSRGTGTLFQLPLHQPSTTEFGSTLYNPRGCELHTLTYCLLTQARQAGKNVPLNVPFQTFYVSVGGHMPWHACGSQRTAIWRQSLPPP